MKKPVKKDDDDIAPEYDFSAGVRGKYREAFRRGSNVVVLAPDVHKVFPNGTVVNEALRALIRVLELAPPKSRPRKALKKTQGRRARAR